MTDVYWDPDFPFADTSSFPILVGLQGGDNVRIPANVLAYAVQQALQSYAFNITSLGNLGAANLSGTNTGDQTAATVPYTPGNVPAVTTVQAAIDALKTYVDTSVTGLLDYKGATNCSANPNYPAALKGDAYVVSVAGKIGGASGTSVDAGDWYICETDNAGGTEASVGSSWGHVEHNLVGALLAANNLSDVASAVASLDNLTKTSADIASASTTDLSTATGRYVNVTGTTTITALGTVASGIERVVRFTGILTLTHNGTSLICVTGANITTAAGDQCGLVSLGSGNWRMQWFTRADGSALTGSGGGSVDIRTVWLFG